MIPNLKKHINLNQTKITTDQRGCGQAKTVGYIYPLVEQLNNISTPTLIICPSINLCEQYHHRFPNARLITSKTCERTTGSVIEAMKDQEKIIIATHETFLMLPDIEYLKQKYFLVIDEALLIYKKSPILRNTPHLTYDWANIFDHNNVRDDEYVLLKQKLSHNDANPGLSKELVKMITSPNHDFYLEYNDYDAMMNQMEKPFVINALLNHQLFVGWVGIHIAAADFDNTSMGALFKKYQINYSTLFDFERHRFNLKIHTIRDAKWSKSKQKHNSDIIEKYNRYVIDNRQDTPILSLRNINNKSQLANEYQLSHNSHGLNRPEYKSCRDFLLEAAILPDNDFKSFLLNQLFGLDKVNRLDDDPVLLMHCVYSYYQAIMRSWLRDSKYNNELVQIFCYDSEIAGLLGHYFEVDVENYIELDREQFGFRKPAMTGAERKRLHRERNKNK